MHAIASGHSFFQPGEIGHITRHNFIAICKNILGLLDIPGQDTYLKTIGFQWIGGWFSEQPGSAKD
jgi:hypothetical protein